ncbi:MAG TPA: LysM peptidoglycan-binding domain-containing protein [Amnibacterium sp.]|nr:LysM peptidoglycan-binding domain-containing protein [Amnibacterium sp.]
MITVQNDWIEYAPVPARRTAVRGGAVCAQRAPLAGDRRGPAHPAPAARRASARPTVAHRSASPGRLRLTRRGRVVLVLLPAVVALSSAFVGISAPFAQADPAASHRAVVVVRAGDTLWALAERLAPARDPRDVVAALERANRLDSAVVLAGSRLTVPGDLVR